MELTEQQQKIISNIDWLNSEEDLQSLAKEIREKFPIGRMHDGIYPWRQSIRELEGALLRFFKEFGTDYTKDEILKATDNYVAQYNPYSCSMRCSKYFIIKDLSRQGGDIISDLANYIDLIRDGDAPSQDSNWLNDLR